MTTTNTFDTLYIVDSNVKKEILQQGKETIDLEYELICDFIKLRHKIGLTQQQMADEAGVIRELIAILETRKKLHK